MLYMSSTSSSTGQLTLTVYFSLDTDPDIAQVQVQNRVNLAVPQLPSAVVQQGVNVQKKSSSIMMLVAVFASDARYSSDYVANYANVYVLDALKRVQGAGQAQVMGIADQAMRIWMNPDRMASLQITTSDIQNAVAAQNALFGAGQIGQQPNAGPVELTFPVVTQRPYTDPKQYERIILRASQDGSRDRPGRRRRARRGGLAPVHRQQPAERRAGHVHRRLPAGRRERPRRLGGGAQDARGHEEPLPGRDRVCDRARHQRLRAAVDRGGDPHPDRGGRSSWCWWCSCSCRASAPPSSARSRSSWRWSSTFTGMLALGFSINLLTLFGLVLAIGMVVDDAIVVVENVERIMVKEHLPPKEATIKSMGEIASSLVAVVLVMASVFVPAAFLPGTTGQLYKQFAITIVVSVTVSGFIALTLTPAMCSVLLRHKLPPQRGPFAWFNREVDRVTRAFGHAVTLMIQRMSVALVLLAVFVYSIYHLFTVLPTSFVPNEDQGYGFAAIIMPDSASLERTQVVAERVDAMLAKIPGVDKRSMVTGYSLLDAGFKTNAGTFFITFADFKERYATLETAREQNARAILTTLFKQAQAIEGATVFPVPPPPIPGIGTTGGFEFWVQDTGAGDPARLDELTQEVIRKAAEQPALASLHTTFRATTQQLRADVDREKATLLGVPVEDVYAAIQAQFGSLAASQFNQFSRVWWVVLQSDAKYRQSPEDLTRLYTRTNQGQMVPLSALVTTRWVTGPDLLPHFNGFPAAKINGNAAPGYSSGQAIAAMEAVAREVLPQGYTFAWSGLAFEEKKSGGTSMLAFVFGLIIVFLVLAAQYESWTLPGAVMTAVPFGILGALTAIWLRGLDNDVYFQIGLLVLIGLGAKNAVLRVTAAVELRKQGKSIMEATIEAGEQRLRPIIMTSLAFAFGVLPLAIAVGAGANARHSIGTGILGGMLGETTLAMLYVPLFFYLFDRLNERSAAKKEKAPRAAAAGGVVASSAPHAPREGN